jgi:hypothetical protein
MRIAVVGSHATGKSTLAADLTRSAFRLDLVEEPYHQLLSAGHVFSDPPTIADFETLFEASVALLAGHRAPTIVFDRSPADYLAYLVALQPDVALIECVTATTTALESLDLVVYVPIEQPDRITHPELPRLRRRVDAILREMFVSQAWGWTIPCIEVRGAPSQRATQVAGHLESAAASSARTKIIVELPNERCS